MASGFRHLSEDISGPTNEHLPSDSNLSRPPPLLLLGILCAFLPPRMITAEGARKVVVICPPSAPQKLAVIVSLVAVFASECIPGARNLGRSTSESRPRISRTVPTPLTYAQVQRDVSDCTVDGSGISKGKVGIPCQLCHQC